MDLRPSSEEILAFVDDDLARNAPETSLEDKGPMADTLVDVGHNT